ncbi:MAG TPA: ABC transporter ATP-binding protein [Bacilli bacterium]
MIRVENVSYGIGKQTVLRHASFHVQQGECFGIIGPNGSGKTTLLKLISGRLRPVSGEIYLDGKQVCAFKQKELAKKVAMLAQEALPPHPLTVYDAVMMGRFPHLGFWNMESRRDIAIAEQILERLELMPFKHSYLNELSGGERQRVAIARAMAQQPGILLLDEPTTYLDIGLQKRILDAVQSWRRESGLTVLMVIHDLNLAAIYCDRLLVISGGKQIMLGSADQVMREDVINQVYGTQTKVVQHPVTGVPQILLSCK